MPSYEPSSVYTQPIDMPSYPPVPVLIAELATRCPDRPAVVADGHCWTYATLATRAAGVAADMLHAGLGRGDVVAVTGRRTPELVARMVGVLASGCVLLPVDPALPEHRRRLLLAEADARMVLGSTAEPGPSAGGTATTGPVPAAGRSATVDLGTLAARVAPDDPAYLVFTSGTTGTPRGVLGQHRGLSHFLAWQRAEFAIGPTDRCAQLTGLSFDVVLRDVLLPLTAGALLCLPPAGEPPAPRQTVDWLRAERITVLHAVPTVLRSWLVPVRVASLRCVFFAGEQLTGELVNDLRAAVSPTTEVVNLYGPTETTLAKSFYRVPDPAPAGPQPVGVPLPNTQILVLDGERRLCPPGEPGEIVIRTPFRTAGYLDGTGFVPNPFGADRDDLVFRTGDRGSRSVDGLLWVLGRLDDQIKINGVRIEPAEVTAVLAAHAAVADAVVLGRTDGDGAARLDGFAVLRPGATATAAQLRADLLQSLPAVMIPDRVTLVQELPVTANGKLDRAALLAAGDSAAVAASPANLFTTIAEIWSDVLGQDVDVDDDFFAIGGHSLHAAAILARVRSALGVSLTMRTLFERPTLAEFARAAEEAGVPDDEPILSTFDRSQRDDDGSDVRRDPR